VVSGQVHSSAALSPEEGSSDASLIGGSVGPRAVLDDVEERTLVTLPGLELRSLCRPARSQALYRLRYRGTPSFSVAFQNGMLYIHERADLHT
jgi:hypothetical protein